MGIGIGVALALTIVMPIAMSSQDLVGWAGSAAGLGLEGLWKYGAFIALDAAAAVCVFATVYAAAWRGERPGAFGVLVWLFAAGSAVANWRHGLVQLQDGAAGDAWWFFPAMSLLGPVLLHVVVLRLRRWVRVDQGLDAAPSRRPARTDPAEFGWLRWLPGIAFRETFGAWKMSIRHQIADPKTAIDVWQQRPRRRKQKQLEAAEQAPVVPLAVIRPRAEALLAGDDQDVELDEVPADEVAQVDEYAELRALLKADPEMTKKAKLAATLQYLQLDPRERSAVAQAMDVMSELGHAINYSYGYTTARAMELRPARPLAVVGGDR
jgi:hypothetical protein